MRRNTRGRRRTSTWAAALVLTALARPDGAPRADPGEFDPTAHGLPAYQDGVPVTALQAREVTPDPLPPPPAAPARGGDTARTCYLGAHPLPPDPDPRSPRWHHETALHFHPDPPIDPHLYAVKDDCHRFVGDPTDFGFQGVTHRFYGAHPLPPGLVALAGGGPWCFIPWAHHHLWQPREPGFALTGPYYTWPGPFSPVFWGAWPHYVDFYRWHYPWGPRAGAGRARQDAALPYPVLVTPTGEATAVVPGPAGAVVLVPAAVPAKATAAPMLTPGPPAPAGGPALRGTRAQATPGKVSAPPARAR